MANFKIAQSFLSAIVAKHEQAKRSGIETGDFINDFHGVSVGGML